MSLRYRLMPTTAQEVILREHCAHARFVWNLGQEQRSEYRPGRGATPGYLEQSRQLTGARATEPWLSAGSREVQQQALRDLDQAWCKFFAGTHGRPGFRKKGRHEGFRIAGVRGYKWDARRLSRRVGEVLIPKIGWVRFRWSRDIGAPKSYRITLDCAGRWHLAFAGIPEPLPSPATGAVVGIDRGVTVSAALSTGEMLTVPRLSSGRTARLLRLQRKLGRGERGSNRRARVKLAVARLKVREADSRKDWVEKVSTDIARRFDVIRIEDLKIVSMTRSARGTLAEPGTNVRQKAGLNREIMRSGWGLLVKRLEDKGPGRVEKIPAAYTSQTCNACGHREKENRKNQAFLCLACGHRDHADINAAKNIARGHRVTARGGTGKLSRPVNREPRIAA